MNQDIYVLVEHLQGQVMDITYVLLAQARQIATGGGRVVAVLLGSNAAALSASLAADEVYNFDHPALAEFSSEAYLKVLTTLIKEKLPRLVLLGETSIGGDIAGGLSVNLGLPLVSFCQSIHAEAGGLQYTCQICAGKIMAEGEIDPIQTVLVTMLPGGFKPELGRSAQPTAGVTALPCPDLSSLRMSVKRVIEPAKGDVDISKEAVLVAVGRGIQQKDNIELAEELAAELGGVVAGSRPIIDQGWLETSRLVGKSGKSVKPKLYLAIGISGAPEHVEGITGSEIIIAVNSNPTAPIFNLAKYGTTIDLLDLLPALSEQIRVEKGK
jgi:electron transfer flavoprotein alpha subunit